MGLGALPSAGPRLQHGHRAIPILAQRAAGAGGAQRLRAALQQMEQQAVMMDALLRDQLAMIIALAQRAIERAVDRGGEELLHGALQRTLPRRIESARIGAATQATGRLLAHADSLRGGGDAAGIGKGFEEVALALGRPAIMAGGHGDEGGVGEGGGVIVGGAGVG